MPPSVPISWSPTYRPGGFARVRSIQGPVTPDTVHSSAAGLIDYDEMGRRDSSVETEEADEPSAMHGSSGACIGPPQGMSMVTILSSSSSSSTSGATRSLSVMEYGYGSGGGTRCPPTTKVASTRNLLFAISSRPLRSPLLLRGAFHPVVLTMSAGPVLLNAFIKVSAGLGNFQYEVILYHAVGFATVSSMVVIMLTVLCNIPVSKLQHKFQTRLMEAQDERLKSMSEALVNMKVLKLYAWDTHFKEVIEVLRAKEYRWLSAFQLQRAYNTFLFWSSPVAVSAATFLACYLFEIPLYPSNVFTFVATLRLIQDPVRSIPDVIGAVIQAEVAYGRIGKFLDATELQNGDLRKKCNGNLEKSIMIKSANFSWDRNPSKPTLENINLELKPGEKAAICGEVGSGKSTLLEAILGEIPNTEGMIQVCGKIAYVSQNAWIQTGSVQDNILFGSVMDGQRYQETIEKCSLVKDFEMMPHGDLTEIGERGVNLSGGQKQRIQLARALYQDADIYLLDDPFSAVLDKCQLREVVQEKEHGLDSLVNLSSDTNSAFLSGKVAEYDCPLKLMKTKGSLLGELVKEYWSHTSAPSIQAMDS
ncbi:hypothetical protein GW17_00025484 [Ensete ventricosum]|nr:hypothetical protein GW17_00025484 [Ensete ventricosum]